MGNGNSQNSSTGGETPATQPRSSRKLQRDPLVTGTPWSFGWNAHGQLGHGDTMSRSVPTQMMVDGGCAAFGCGQYHTLGVSGTGNLFTMGRGDINGGTGSDLRPRIISNIKGSTIHQVTAGRTHSIALTTPVGGTGPGSLYSWGHGTHGALGHGFTDTNVTPCLIAPSSHAQNTAYVACGQDFTASINENGALFTWGKADGGRLGNGKTAQVFPSPGVVPALKGHYILHVACGNFHAAAVTGAGQLYTWGCGVDGQLGLGDKSSTNVPTTVDLLQRETIVKVAAGAEHTVALTSDGEVFTFGSSTYGQLGHGDTEGMASPMVVEKLLGEGMCACDAACGWYHTIILLSTGETASWGHGGYGQLGHGNTLNQMSPKGIASLRSQKTVFISAGAWHSVAITDQGGATLSQEQQDSLSDPSLPAAVDPIPSTGRYGASDVSYTDDFSSAVCNTEEDDLFAMRQDNPQSWAAEVVTKPNSPQGDATIEEPPTPAEEVDEVGNMAANGDGVVYGDGVVSRAAWNQEDSLQMTRPTAASTTVDSKDETDQNAPACSSVKPVSREGGQWVATHEDGLDTEVTSADEEGVSDNVPRVKVSTAASPISFTMDFDDADDDGAFMTSDNPFA